MITKAFVLGAALTVGLALPLAAGPASAEAPEASVRADDENGREGSQHVRRRADLCSEHHVETGRTTRKPATRHDDTHEAKERGDD